MQKLNSQLDYPVSTQMENTGKQVFSPSVYNFQSSEQYVEHISNYPLSHLCTINDDKILVTSIPLVVSSVDKNGYPSRLTGHIAKRNPHLCGLQNDTSAVAVFSGANSYISPRWFKVKKTVPTWNYVDVQIRGKIRLVDDTSNVLAILENAIEHFEYQLNKKHKSSRWYLHQANKQLVTSLLSGIVGIHLDVESIEGVCRLAQDKPREDQVSIISGLKQTSSKVAQEVANMMSNLLKM